MKNETYTLEVPVDHPTTAEAVASFVTRVEVCTQLDQHGFTPSTELVESICKSLAGRCSCTVLIRPDDSDSMCVSISAMESAQRAIAQLADAGADAAAFGFLDQHNQLDHLSNAKLANVCRDHGIEPCLHRAFDFHDRLEDAVEIAADIGIIRVLSAGTSSLDQAISPLDVRTERLKQIVFATGQRFQVIAAGGVRGHNALQFLACTPHLHASCRTKQKLSPDELFELLRVFNDRGP